MNVSMQASLDTMLMQLGHSAVIRERGCWLRFEVLVLLWKMNDERCTARLRVRRRYPFQLHKRINKANIISSILISHSRHDKLLDT